MTLKNQGIADVQSRADSRNLEISKVGIRGLKHPIQVEMASGDKIATVAEFEMTVALAADVKGTHMSRFVELLNEGNIALSASGIKSLLDSMLTRLGASSGAITASFPYFINKAAPVSKVSSLMDYDVTMMAEVKDQQLTSTIKVVVPVTSLCPCSKEISEYGAHNQRSHITVVANIEPTASITVEEIVAMVEQQASCELYGLLKRPDEKYVTERAYDNPKFVEDLVRDIAQQCIEHQAISSFSIESENFESIHNHSAYAMITG